MIVLLFFKKPKAFIYSLRISFCEHVSLFFWNYVIHKYIYILKKGQFQIYLFIQIPRPTNQSWIQQYQILSKATFDPTGTISSIRGFLEKIGKKVLVYYHTVDILVNKCDIFIFIFLRLMHCVCYYVSVMDILTLRGHSVRSSISAIGRVPCSNNPKGGTEATRASQRRRPKLQFQAVLEVEEVQLETQL